MVQTILDNISCWFWICRFKTTFRVGFWEAGKLRLASLKATEIAFQSLSWFKLSSHLCKFCTQNRDRPRTDTLEGLTRVRHNGTQSTCPKLSWFRQFLQWLAGRDRRHSHLSFYHIWYEQSHQRSKTCLTRSIEWSSRCSLSLSSLELQCPWINNLETSRMKE